MYYISNNHRYLQAQEWELFRVFESMEFELMDSFKTSQGFSSEVKPFGRGGSKGCEPSSAMHQVIYFFYPDSYT